MNHARSKGGVAFGAILAVGVRVAMRGGGVGVGGGVEGG